MSSTNRGGARADSDFYPTPHYVVRRLLERLALPGGRWLELGAGTGDVVRAVLEVRADVSFSAVELRAECRPDLEASGADEVVILSAQEYAAEFAACAQPQPFDVVIMNPPFSDALRFVQLALPLAPWVVCLERSPWIGDAEERFDYFSELMPDEYRVGRIDFDGRGGDSIPYSWFVWGPWQRQRTRGALELLAPTPAAQRVRGNLPPPRQAELFTAAGAA